MKDLEQIVGASEINRKEITLGANDSALVLRPKEKGMGVEIYIPSLIVENDIQAAVPQSGYISAMLAWIVTAEDEDAELIRMAMATAYDKYTEQHLVHSEKSKIVH